jgi:uncharacterized repeat protein (TIGR01451 family)
MSKKIIIFLILFIILVLGFVGFWVYREGTFSKQILKLEILGPDSANLGQEVEYTIKYKNNGNFVLENPKLTVDLPDNSLAEDGKSRITKELDDIYPGGEDFIKIKARLIGKQDDLKVLKAYLSYKPKNLSVRYESDTTFTTKIADTPITLDFDVSTKAEKGKELQYSLNYFSNVDYQLEGLSIKIAPVAGFEIKSATPSSIDNQEWKISKLNKAEGGRISVTGKINSDASDSLTFSAQLGMWKNGSFIVIKETTAQVQTTQSMLYISQQVNGSSDYVASPGETLHYQIFFRNIGSSLFENLYIIATMNGDALDMSSLKSGSGQVQSNGNMIVWDWKEVPQLRKVEVQDEASVDFYVKVKDNFSPADSNPEKMIISDQINISQITKNFSIKVSSGLMISQAASPDDSNSSDFLTAGKQTFYTIDWNISNYSSDMKNVKVKAILPPNVSLTGKILPTTETSNFSFDSVSREIVWSVGDITAGTGVSGDPVSLYFQVALVPDVSQRGAVAPLIGSASVSGENQFTNSNANSSTSGVSSGIIK